MEREAKYDSVSRPRHYCIEGLEQESIEVIKAIVEHNCVTPWAAVLLKDTLKYLFRFGRKNGLEDLLKAKQYLEWLIEEYGDDEGRA